MGISTDAKLFYGFLINEDSPDHDVCEKLMEERHEELRAAETLTGCMIEYHGSDKCMQYAVVTKELTTTAYRGDPKKILHTYVLSSLSEPFHRFCETFGLKYQEPAWWLASYWG